LGYWCFAVNFNSLYLLARRKNKNSLFKAPSQEKQGVLVMGKIPEPITMGRRTKPWKSRFGTVVIAD
jgi:hypothetical protein